MGPAECVNLHPWLRLCRHSLTHSHLSYPVCMHVCFCEGTWGCEWGICIVLPPKTPCRSMAFLPRPHSIPSPVRVNEAKNTYHLLPTYVNEPIQSPLATEALTLHLLLRSRLSHTLILLSSSNTHTYFHIVLFACSIPLQSLITAIEGHR